MFEMYKDYKAAKWSSCLSFRVFLKLLLSYFTI